MWNHIKYHPWVGEKYHKPDIWPCRLAILGESNYTKPEFDCPQLVIKCVKRHLRENDDPNFSRFANKVRRVASLEGQAPPKQDFWSNVAFYNFVQQLVGSKARARPTDEMWSDSIDGLHEFVKELRPARLLVLGKANWLNLLKLLPHDKIDGHTVKFSLAGDRLKASYINHPSSPLRYSQWRPVVQQLLQ